MLSWIIGIIIFLFIIEELIYYLENRIVFGKRRSRIKSLIARFKKEDRGEEIIIHKPKQRRSRQ